MQTIVTSNCVVVQHPPPSGQRHHRDVLARSEREAHVARTSVSCTAVSPPRGARRVHRITLSGWGSPDATPCGNRARTSRQPLRDPRGARANAGAAPIAGAAMTSRRRSMIVRLLPRSSTDRIQDGTTPHHAPAGKSDGGTKLRTVARARQTTRDTMTTPMAPPSVLRLRHSSSISFGLAVIILEKNQQSVAPDTHVLTMTLTC